jgi:hypothetical protein
MLEKLEFDGLRKDLCYAARGLLRSPGFAAVAILTPAVAIAVNTTVFSRLDVVSLRPLPGEAGSQRLVAFESLDEIRFVPRYGLLELP